MLNEVGLIKKISRVIKTDSSVIRGIGDDTAVLKYTKDKCLLFTADMLVEGVDFTGKASPQDIGHKALACSLSDIAAMAGTPKYALVSLGLPKNNAREFINKFYRGLLKLAGDFKVNIVGGDLSYSKRIVIDVSMIGEVRKEKVALRSTAKTGDLIFTSGALGGSIYGKHLKFTPRIREANLLVKEYKINSMMDISDGLALDLNRLTESSNVGAVIYEELIPVSAQAKSFHQALYMGEDFELLFTMAHNEARRLLKNSPKMFKLIGEITDKKYGVRIINRFGKEKILEPKGYQHF